MSDIRADNPLKSSSQEPQTPLLERLESSFDPHAVAIAERQYFQDKDKTLGDMFSRVARWVAKPEQDPETMTQRFTELMLRKRFCPGGRVLAGAETLHGNVLNCFVQDGAPELEGTTDWVLQLATKLALVTKVGGGNGVNLDPLAPKTAYAKPVGALTIRMDSSHPDYDNVRRGRYMNLVQGEYVTKGYRFAHYHDTAQGEIIMVGDSVEAIWQAASQAVRLLLQGRDVTIDLSQLRPEGTPVKGSGGTSSGASSFAVEVFDNFGYWASLGGAEHAGAVATLRYVFAPTLRVIRQGGCLHPDTLVHSDKGTLRLRELVDPYQYGWQAHALKVATDEGWKDSTQAYNNGNASTLKVVLANGQSIQGTPNHKLKVMRPDGRREWVRLEELQAGDSIIQVLDQHTGNPVMLSPMDAADLHHNTKNIHTPEILDARLAFFLGYLWGDGFISDNRIGYAVAHGSPMMTETPKLFAELFGLALRKEQKPNDKSVTFVASSRALTDWLTLNGLHKGKASSLSVPRAIRQAPRPVVAAFLRGLFEADGSINHGYATLSSASKHLIDDVAVLLAGLGIPSKLRRMAPNSARYSNKACFHLSVSTHVGHRRFNTRIGWIEGSRLAALADFTPDNARESCYMLPQAAALLTPTFAALPVGVKGKPSPHTQVRKTLSRYIRGERNLTLSGYQRLQQDAALAPLLPELEPNEHYVTVKEVVAGGRILTLDLSVAENKTYLANGFVSHNTRRGAGMATMSANHPDIQDFITCKDLEREQHEGDISTFNISVLASDALMQAGDPILDTIAEHAWQTGEPGLIFVDRINEHNAMYASMGAINATNPCGEIPLYPGEPCDLGAMNLSAYVRPSHSERGIAQFDFETFQQDVSICIRFLDNVLEVNHFALEDNRVMSQRLRRLGLGVMGLADALIKMGYRYDSEAGREAVAQIIAALRDSAHQASQQLAEERGAFPDSALSALSHKRRNVALLTVAPTGTTSMLMGVSSGVEPIFAPFIYRKIGDSYAALIAPLFQELLAEHPAPAGYQHGDSWDWDAVVAQVSANHGSVQGLEFIPQAVKDVLVCAHDISPEDHVRMQATVQRTFDAGGHKLANSISKTINMPNAATVADVQRAYSLAYQEGCKGITVYRDGSRQFQVLSTSKQEESQADSSPANEVAQDSSPLASTNSARREARFERPARLTGFTDAVKLTTSNGEKRGFYVTVNTENGAPREVFIISGKAGDEANADAEALGRLASMALQYGVPAEAIVKTLRGISGGMYGSYQGRMVASKADIIAIALETTGVSNPTASPCPECASPLRYEEGCQKCEACGYSRCG